MFTPFPWFDGSDWEFTSTLSLRWRSLIYVYMFDHKGWELINLCPVVNALVGTYDSTFNINVNCMDWFSNDYQNMLLLGVTLEVEIFGMSTSCSLNNCDVEDLRKIGRFLELLTFCNFFGITTLLVGNRLEIAALGVSSCYSLNTCGLEVLQKSLFQDIRWFPFNYDPILQLYAILLRS